MKEIIETAFETEIEFEPSKKLADLLGINFDPESHIYRTIELKFTIRLSEKHIFGGSHNWTDDETEIELNSCIINGKDLSEFIPENEYERIQERAFDIAIS